MEMMLFFWVGCAILCWVVANGKNRFGFGWFVLGLIFGIFALIVVVILPSTRQGEGAPSPWTHVKCPDCRELVLKDARKCKHCGCSLVPQP